MLSPGAFWQEGGGLHGQAGFRTAAQNTECREFLKDGALGYSTEGGAGLGRGLTVNRTKYFWLFSPTQLLTQGQWWSIFRIHRLQTLQGPQGRPSGAVRAAGAQPSREPSPSFCSTLGASLGTAPQWLGVWQGAGKAGSGPPGSHSFPTGDSHWPTRPLFLFDGKQGGTKGLNRRLVSGGDSKPRAGLPRGQSAGAVYREQVLPASSKHPEPKGGCQVEGQG